MGEEFTVQDLIEKLEQIRDRSKQIILKDPEGLFDFYGDVETMAVVEKEEVVVIEPRE